MSMTILLLGVAALLLALVAAGAAGFGVPEDRSGDRRDRPDA